MDHIKDQLGEIFAEIADEQMRLMREGMKPGDAPVSGLGRTYPSAHRINKVSRSNSPYNSVSD